MECYHVPICNPRGKLRLQIHEPTQVRVFKGNALIADQRMPFQSRFELEVSRGVYLVELEKES